MFWKRQDSCFLTALSHKGKRYNKYLQCEVRLKATSVLKRFESKPWVNKILDSLLNPVLSYIRMKHYQGVPGLNSRLPM